MKFDASVGLLASVLGVMAAFAPGGNVLLSTLLAIVLYVTFSDFVSPPKFENIMWALRILCVMWATLLVAQQMSLDWLAKEGVTAVEDATFELKEQKATGRLSTVPTRQVQMPHFAPEESSYIVQSLGNSKGFMTPTSIVLKKVKQNWFGLIEIYLQLVGCVLLICSVIVRATKISVEIINSR